MPRCGKYWCEILTVNDHQKRLTDHPDPGEVGASAEAAMYRMIIENTSDLIIRYDRDRTRIYV
jgi:hypothetical protein